MRLEQAKVQGRTSHTAQFQFHKGAIRTGRGRIVRQNHTNFNSIKVRLEHDNEHIPYLERVFQFHKGAIRTVPLPTAVTKPDVISIP